MDVALIGLLGVVLGSFVTLVLPWIRDEIERARRLKETVRTERRDALLAAETALLDYRQKSDGANLARVGSAMNELMVRIEPDDEVVMDVFTAALAMIQQPRARVPEALGEMIWALNRWARGDLTSAELIPEIERRAGLLFSADRKSVGFVA